MLPVAKNRSVGKNLAPKALRSIRRPFRRSFSTCVLAITTCRLRPTTAAPRANPASRVRQRLPAASAIRLPPLTARRQKRPREVRWRFHRLAEVAVRRRPGCSGARRGSLRRRPTQPGDRPPARRSQSRPKVAKRAASAVAVAAVAVAASAAVNTAAVAYRGTGSGGSPAT